MLVKVGEPAALFVSVEDTAKRLRIDASAEEAADLERMIRAATATAERRTNRIMAAGAYEWSADGWRYPLTLPVVPVRDIIEIRYIGQSGAEVALDPSVWSFRADERGCTVSFPDISALPSLGGTPQPVRVRLDAGYDDAHAVWKRDPIDMQMVLLLVGFWHANRASTDKVPQAFIDLADMRRVYR